MDAVVGVGFCVMFVSVPTFNLWDLEMGDGVGDGRGDDKSLEHVGEAALGKGVGGGNFGEMMVSVKVLPVELDPLLRITPLFFRFIPSTFLVVQ